ncbi:MAG: SMP-30/gluconolactonase/LRE family protein [Thermosynechococcaceae cyanobacterium]
MSKVVKTKIEVYDPRMGDLIDSGAVLIQIDSSSQHTEGPVYMPANDSVIWSDVSGNRLLRWRNDSVSVLRTPSCYQNGNALDLEGRLVSCSHGDRAIIRQDHDHQWRTLVNCYQDKQLNSPNDLVVKSDGTIWFTDPPFGLTQPNEGLGGEQEQPGSFVFRFDPATGDIEAVIIEMERPNGLVFSPDERLLYVSDTSAYEDAELYHDIRVYDVVEGRTVTNGRVFTVVDPGQPDGLCVDWQGHIFTSSKDSVQVYTPAGSILGKILVPEICANLTFGGVNRDRLLITAGTSLYAIDLNTQGIQPVSKEIQDGC